VWPINLQYQSEAAAYKLQICNGGVSPLYIVHTFTEAESSFLELTVAVLYRLRDTVGVNVSFTDNLGISHLSVAGAEMTVKMAYTENHSIVMRGMSVHATLKITTTLAYDLA